MITVDSGDAVGSSITMRKETTVSGVMDIVCLMQALVAWLFSWMEMLLENTLYGNPQESPQCY